MKESIKVPLILGMVCLISTFLLGVVYIITNPIIESTNAKILNEKLSEIIIADNFEKLSVNDRDLFIKIKNTTNVNAKKSKINGQIEEIFLAKRNNETIGIIILYTTKGYSGNIKIIFGISNGKITKVNIISHSETPGVGEKITKSEFLNQFTAKTIEKKDYDTITGATISSSAVINSLLEQIKNLNDILTEDEKNKLKLLQIS